ncbi:hypothetical protein BaRGS_00010412, partial [Batillaria attramentaria]
AKSSRRRFASTSSIPDRQWSSELSGCQAARTEHDHSVVSAGVCVAHSPLRLFHAGIDSLFDPAFGVEAVYRREKILPDDESTAYTIARTCLGYGGGALARCLHSVARVSLSE